MARRASRKHIDMGGQNAPRFNENELQVLRLLNAGLRPREIAVRLDYVEATIRKRIVAINGKFGTSSYHVSLLLARLSGIVKAPPE